MKKIILFISLLIFPFFVNASTISKIDMDIVLSENGKAVVTETWDANVTQGTEGWHPYYNLGYSKIRVISASMDGKEYEIVDNWRENSSLSDKAYKAGLYYDPDSNEVDVVFGISSYGSHKYVIKYEITSFVSSLADSDMIYWTLFPYDFSSEPEDVSIKISGPYEYPDTLDVWGFGIYDAPCYVKDGAIYMTSDGNKVTSDEYMVILAKFPKGTFESDSVLDNNFEYYLNMANEGATPSIHKEEKLSVKEIILNIIGVIFSCGIFAGIVALISRSSKNDQINFGPDGKKLGDVPNFRDIPCNKDIFYAFWVSENYGMAKNRNDFLGAVLLKWIHDGNVTIEKIESKKLFKTKEENVVTFVKRPEGTNNKEQELYDYMNEASGDGKLETNEFKKWCRTNYEKILDWFTDSIKYERGILASKHLLERKEYTGGLIFKYKYHQYEVSDNLREEAKRLLGLKKFFKEFSRMNEKEPIEVALWNEYLMYAQILGVADEVMKQFKKLYPEVITDMEANNYNYDAFLFANSISSEGVKAASAARSAAENYSSGGGGFSSGGGGGGSFGGGGGGGGFR